MSRIEVRIPAEPECWDSCGTCRAETLSVVESLVKEGDTVTLYQPLLLVEAYKTEMEVSSPATGLLVDWWVDEGDEVAANELIGIIITD